MMIAAHSDDYSFALIVVGIAFAIAAVKITRIIVTKGGDRLPRL